MVLTYLKPTTSFSNEIESISEKVRSINLRIGIGGTLTFDDIQFKNINISPSARLFWKPEHLLRVGIETSYINVKSEILNNMHTEFGITNLKTNISAVPLDLVFSMEFKNLEFFAGGGIAFIDSKVEAFDNQSNSSLMGDHYLFGVTLKLYDSKFLSMSLDSKTNIFPQINQIVTGINFCTQVNCIYKRMP